MDWRFKLSILSSQVTGTFEGGSQAVLNASKSELLIQDSLIQGVGKDYYTIYLQKSCYRSFQKLKCWLYEVKK